MSPAWSLKNILVDVAVSAPVPLWLDAPLFPFFQQDRGQGKGPVRGRTFDGRAAVGTGAPLPAFMAQDLFYNPQGQGLRGGSLQPVLPLIDFLFLGCLPLYHRPLHWVHGKPRRPMPECPHTPPPTAGRPLAFASGHLGGGGFPGLCSGDGKAPFFALGRVPSWPEPPLGSR